MHTRLSLMLLILWSVLGSVAEAAPPAHVTVSGGRVKINGEILTDYVSRQVFVATDNTGDAIHAAQMIQSALNEAILEWRPQRNPALWPGILEAAMNRMRGSLANERARLVGHGARLQAHDALSTILLQTAIELRLFPLSFVRFLQPQSLAAIQSPTEPRPSRIYPGAPCPGGRPRINVASKLMYWDCP